MKIISLYVLCFFTCFFSSAQTKEELNHKIATDYMQAYGNWDFDKMKTFYADNIHFEDPTAKEAFGQPFIFDGKENVYNFFSGVFKDRFENDKPPYVHFTIEKNYTSGSYVVINSTFECVLPSSWFKKDSNETILISIPFVTILCIENGLITKHTDYGDYSKYKEQINAQIKG